MPIKRIRLTKDEYRIMVKENGSYKHHVTYDNIVSAQDELGYLYRKGVIAKLVRKRVPNPNAHTVYYVCDTSPNGHRRIRAKALTVEKAETDLANYRAQFPDSANNFFVRKTVEHV